jgi:uncharacterized protein DUF4386
VRVAGAIILIVAPLGFNLFFLLLARWFEYPEILRKPTPYILARYRSGGARLILTWWGFMLSGVVLLPGVVLLAQAMAVDRLAVLPVTIAFGALAALVQILGLVRWVYLVPYLARTHEGPAATEATRQATAVVFQAFHRSLGVGVGEHLGYLFTGMWTVLVGVGMLQGSLFPGWLGLVGIVLGAGQIVGSAEFLGQYEELGWALAGALIPAVYLMWSAWLITTGVFLLLG